MSGLDFVLFALYLAGVLGIGIYFLKKNKNAEDYYVGGRKIPAFHVGLSIVATDVGGGFSIGLGGLGFAIGLAGSWMLFTGLVGAWLSAVFIIPRIKAVDARHNMMTYPDFLRHRYGSAVALVAGIISAGGYLGFTGGQVLAGAKLASATILADVHVGMDPVSFGILVIGAVMIVYTVLGGLKAVIYTDTIQWIILLGGLIFLAIPFALREIGGFNRLFECVGPAHFDLTNVTVAELVRWAVAILPIWVVAMTLYQRMYACRDAKQARRAWYIAGLFEYPVMAFVGVFLGICARAIYPDLPLSEKETALPMLIAQVLPLGVAGIVVAAYFSAIMSTADSCLLASSSNIVNDLIERYLWKGASARALIRLSQGVTLVAGAIAMLLASQFDQVLDGILYAYEFLVSGLFVPTLGAYFWPRASNAGAFGAMVVGGGLTLTLLLTAPDLPTYLPAAALGIAASGIVFVCLSLALPDQGRGSEASA
ncbi:MAG: sodium:solute symporter family protein [Myxococcota bacterium]|nr:sodium:solute symporter family protein [Myxococcota bacterium]